MPRPRFSIEVENSNILSLNSNSKCFPAAESSTNIHWISMTDWIFDDGFSLTLTFTNSAWASRSSMICRLPSVCFQKAWTEPSRIPRITWSSCSLKSIVACHEGSNSLDYARTDYIPTIFKLSLVKSRISILNEPCLWYAW